MSRSRSRRASNGHVVDAPGLRPEHYEVFDCAVGTRAIKAMGHVLMMAAVQPFISGAISKTVNLPETATVEEIADVYTQGWKLGLKALAVYRDNCKVGQPLSTEKKSTESIPAAVESSAPAVVETRPVRRRLPKARPSLTTSFSVAGAEGYMTAGSYPDDGLGEVFLKLGKQGSTLAGMMDAFSIAISIALQYGVPLETYVQKFTNMRFEPAGMTDDPDVRMAQSVVDYVFRRLALDHLSYEVRAGLGIHTSAERMREVETGSYLPAPAEDDADLEQIQQSAPVVEQHLHIVEPAPAATNGATSNGSKASAAGTGAGRPTGQPLPVTRIGRPDLSAVRSTPELLEALQGKAADAPLCITCGTKMRPSGSCYVCEGCGSTSGCS
jgi:ribonucleoside-diphosphate reductase alpha chain